MSSKPLKIDVYFQFGAADVVTEKAIFTDFDQICQIVIEEKFQFFILMIQKSW